MMLRFFAVIGASLALLLAGHALAFDVPPNDGFITDMAGVLSSEEEAALESDLSQYRDATSNEIAVLIVNTLNGEPIADASVDVGRKWGIGSAENDNGILLFIAYSDRELFLATGYGLEGAVPDIVAKGIIDEEIVPHFRDGDYAQGIQAGVEALKKHIAGEYTSDRYMHSESGGIGTWIFIVIIVLFQFLVALLARTKSWWLGGVIGVVAGVIIVLFVGWWLAIPLLALFGLILDFVVSRFPALAKSGRRGRWTSGGWRGGSGGGGFGGGSFGGGGAGGRW
ncbi:methanol dehydrogenase [Candidatus Peregrinibacteria bacterium CG10_big_fil_rev_8_21_14_0_10_55_24]|nr:MAG: methanol dehydrogenase [Candidatus Peregrinibacteria bacterium CG10_big_fil_rev_8_21_14_0_10_55_24]